MPGRARGIAGAGGAGDEVPFWKQKRLGQLTRGEWESLCDGCGRCCLNKLEDMETGEIYWTDVACRLLDDGTCRCKDYEHRQDHVPDCISLTPEIVPLLSWLPPTCAYRLVAEGRDLYWWHPLVSGDPLSVHMAGISVRGQTRSEADVPAAKLEEYMVAWPGEDPMQPPKPARKKGKR